MPFRQGWRCQVDEVLLQLLVVSTDGNYDSVRNERRQLDRRRGHWPGGGMARLTGQYKNRVADNSICTSEVETYYSACGHALSDKFAIINMSDALKERKEGKELD